MITNWNYFSNMMNKLCILMFLCGLYNLNGSSFSNTAQIEFGWEIRKRLNIKTAYRYVDTKVSYKTGILQKSLVSMHRAFVNISYETKRKLWLFDATLQFKRKKTFASNI